ncbi:MAG: N-acetylmuramoyl-L-alanine amidase [Saprospiraceae bacterium]|nr:N-acetylmuramoyl-L-alanine amidase [Saprospiraceae bacterium]
MKKAIFLLAALCCIGAGVAGQSSRTVVDTWYNRTEGQISGPFFIPLANANPFLAWSAVWESNAPGMWVRFASSAHQFQDNWEWIGPDDHATEMSGRTVGQLKFTVASSRFFQIRADMPVGDIAFHFFNPGPETTYTPGFAEEALLGCPCPLPPPQRRNDWCPAGNCPPNPSPSFTAVSHLIVHHSATTNTATNWPAVVRSFWDFHVNTNGWADIGYNWLIDPNGVLYEGRGDNVLGAHFCGTNGQTMGVCVIGDFTTATPTAAALNMLDQLLAWKACSISADPLSTMFHNNSGLTLHRISGHRDGCSTQCPGNAFYPMLPSVRQSVVDHIADVCNAVSTPEQEIITSEMLVFPNPAGEQINIKAPGISEGVLDLFEMPSGKAVRSGGAFRGPVFTFNISGLPAGVYRSRLRDASGEERNAVFIKQ